MASQEHTRPQRRGDGPDDVPEPAPAPAAASATDTDIDGILDEIDEVLETNAEEFVRSFVQKGGQ